MDLTKVIAITGKSGLYQLASQTKGGFVVEDLVTNKKTAINANSQVSLLQNISIFTLEAEVPLPEVFKNIALKFDIQRIEFDKNDSKQLRSLMEEVLPEYDKSRVYDSDLKKLFSWYNILIDCKIITEESLKEPEPEETEETEEKN